MSDKDLYILKLGGSVITAKKKNQFKINYGALQRIANEIKAARKKRKFKLIVIHGAGPFGHAMVEKYKINNGIHTKKHAEGFVKTHFMCELLNKEVVGTMLNIGLPAVTVQPSATIVQHNKKIIGFYLEPIEVLFDISDEIIPVMYGTIVPDLVLKGSVVSGDAILAYLAKNLNAKKLFLGSDVSGIYDSDPHRNKNAKLIPKIDSTNFHYVISKISGSTAVDVTAGMRGKIESLYEMKLKMPIFIFDLNKKGNLYKLLIGKKIKCTEISFR